MEPKNSADNSAPSMPKQDEPQDAQDATPQAQPSQEVSVDITEGQGPTTDTADAPAQDSGLDKDPIDSETSAGIGSAAAGGAVGDMPSLTSEAPTDQVAVAPTDPAEGAVNTPPTGVDTAPNPSVAPEPQAPLAPVTDDPAPTQNAVPPVAPAPVPGHHDNKMILLLAGAGALIIVIIALVFLI